MTGNEVARNNLGKIEFDQFGNYDRTTKHWILLHLLESIMPCITCQVVAVEKGMVSRDAIDSTLTAYNNACADMRSQARDILISI